MTSHRLTHDRRPRAPLRQHRRHHRRHPLHSPQPHRPEAQCTTTVCVKAESFNPAASVKDRLAISIIEEAERRGDLEPGQTVVEATSGNTGIGLAMVCAAKGYPLVVTMADSFSVERRRLMRFLGAKVVLTPRAAKGMGRYKKAQELAEANGWFYARQFETPDNATIHENTTARELLADFKGERLDYWVTGYGTRAARSPASGACCARKRATRRSILSEPSIAQLLGSGVRAAARRRPLFHASGSLLHPAPRSRAGLPTSFPSSCRSRSTKHCYDELIPIAGPDPDRPGRGGSPSKRGSLTGISGERLARGRGFRSPGARRKARCFAACCPTPANATCRHRCSRAWRPR